ncbi:protein of unknown function DUF2470 [Dillenia turbinata]|uniref:DUF2470 domain-containing protein n=1 Tax=Dillenia turbinata TaxID=194707 RepID=A0AAN8UIA4_9MAGN
MISRTQTLLTTPSTSIFPTTNSQFHKQSAASSCRIKLRKTQFRKSLYQTLKCSATVVSEPIRAESEHKPSPAEVSRTIMELSSVGTISTLTHEGWPLGFGVRFAVDSHGTPVLCFDAPTNQISPDMRSSLHVQLIPTQLKQCGLRTPQCTIQGIIEKPEDRMALKRLHSVWKKRFGEEVDENLIYVIAVERVLQMEDFNEDGMWVTSVGYRGAKPDPLRDFAEKLVDEINANNMEDVLRFSRICADLNFQVSEAKIVWVDRLGFDMRLWSAQNGVYEIRIPFPREVADEKGAKSSFNCMSQLAWEVEKNFQALDFEKVKQLKQIIHRRT